MRPTRRSRKPAFALCATLLSAACGPADIDDATDAAEAEAGATLQPQAWIPEGQLLRLALSNAAITPPSGRPAALAYLPRRFDASAPLSVVVYLHGWNNCVENVVRPTGTACSAGGAARTGFNLAGQLEASGKNAILLLPELSYDRASSSAGRLEEPGFFRALLAEALTKLRPQLGVRGVADVTRLIVASHSGGYNAAAAIAARGGVPVSEVVLFDSLYAREDDFASWMGTDLPDLASSPWNGARRFMSIYTQGGGTYDDNRAFAAEVGTFGLGAGLYHDRTTSTWDAATYRRGVLFKYSALTHDGTARYYFQRFLATSPIRGTGGDS